MSCAASIYTVPVPGPQGTPGASGTNGTNGENAFTVSTASFTMPAEGASVTIAVVSSAAFAVGQIVYVKAGGASGYFTVASKPTATSLELTNLANTGTGAYTTNSTPGTVFASSASISPGGLQGPSGSNASGSAPDTAKYILQTTDVALSSAQSLGALATGLLKSTTTTGVLSTIPVGVADTQIAPIDDASGLTSGEALFATAAGIESRSASATRTALGLVLGTNVQAFDATLQALSALGTAADKLAYTTGVDAWSETAITSLARTFLAAADIYAAAAALNLLTNYGLLGFAFPQINVTGDTLVTMASGSYIIDRIVVYNASEDLSAGPVTAGVFTAAGGGGTTLAADQTLAACTSTTKYLALTLAAIVGTDTRNESTLYVRVGTPHASPGTFSVQVFGWRTRPTP